MSDKLDVKGKGHHYKGNNFYIFDDINEEFSDIILPAFIECVKKEEEKTIKDDINIFLRSYGGLLEEAFYLISWIDYCKKKNIKVNTFIMGNVSSAASMIAVSGHKRYGSRTASHLLHFARCWEHSHNPDMAKNNFKFNLWIQSELVDVYKRNTKLTDIENKLKTDNYYIFGIKDLLKNGLIDEVL